jgi:hypothetical protein
MKEAYFIFILEQFVNCYEFLKQYFHLKNNQYIGFPKTDQAKINSWPTLSSKLSTKATTKPLPYHVSHMPGTPQLY